MLPRTHIVKESEFDSKWYLFDAKDQILGRLATKISRVLTGKGRVTFAPHQVAGDHVIVVNASKIKVTGNKLKDKIYKHYTGYPGGLVEYNLETLLRKKPREVIFRAVERMLPKSSRGQARMMRRLHVYADSTHEQQAQKPIEVK